jgi:hypothetical protein
MHDVNKTISVLVTSTHSKFAPMEIIDACGGVDSFVVEEGSEDASEISAFVKALAYKYPGKGNALVRDAGALVGRTLAMCGFDDALCWSLSFPGVSCRVLTCPDVSCRVVSCRVAAVPPRRAERGRGCGDHSRGRHGLKSH